MLLPLFLALFSHSKPVTHRLPSSSPSSHRLSAHAGRHKVARRVETAVKGDIQFVMIAPPSQFGHPAPNAGQPTAPNAHLSPPRRLMPLTATLRLDTRALEETEEADLIAAINNERTRRGLGPLAEDPLLNVTARTHSREMCSLGYFDHVSPTSGSQTPLDRYLAGLRAWGEGKPEAALVGENIFFASATDAVYNASYAHASLMNSPGHRANILEKRFTKVGVGLYRDSQGRFWVTEMFLRDME